MKFIHSQNTFIIGLHNKNVLIGINIGISIALAVSVGVFAYLTNAFTQFISMFLYLLFVFIAVTNVISLCINWKINGGIKSFFPIVITLLTIPLISLSSKIGYHKNIEVFNGQLDLYEKAAKEIESQISDHSMSLSKDSIPEEYRPLAYHIFGEKIEDDVFAVTFVWGGGFPVRHEAYTYISNGKLPEEGSLFRENWPRATRINEKWFRVGD